MVAMIPPSDIQGFINRFAKELSISLKNPVCDYEDLAQHGYLAYVASQRSWSGKEGNFDAYATTCIRRAMTRCAKRHCRETESLSTSIVCRQKKYSLEDILSIQSLTPEEKVFMEQKAHNEQVCMSRSTEWRMKRQIRCKLRKGGFVHA